MSATRLNAAEKDLEKFIKFLAIKTVQVVVQSRLGTKIQTQCNPLATGNDWFNIVIEDYPDVYAETKQALNLTPGETILNRLPVCVEISLRTVDGDQMVLEVWSLDLQSPPPPPPTSATENNKTNNDQVVLKVAHQIYNRMSILLKSLISLTRATPAYKLSRRQCPDSYRIFYKVYAEEKPQVHALGEGYKNVRVGHLNTIVGNLTMSVAYRTKMTFSPTTTKHCDSAIMLKSDHFLKDQSPKHIRYHHNNYVKKIGEKKFIDIDKPLRPGAFVDVSKIRQYTEDDFILPETPPFDWLIKKNRTDSTGSSIHEDRTQSPLGTNNNNADFKSNYEHHQPPQSAIKSLLVPVPLDDETKTKKNPRTALPPDDDNLLKELNFPFASPTSHVNDLARFYRDCYNAPPLHSCCGEVNSVGENKATATEGAIDPVEDLSKQLELFETSMDDYENLVMQLGCSTTSSKTTSSTKST